MIKCLKSMILNYKQREVDKQILESNVKVECDDPFVSRMIKEAFVTGKIVKGNRRDNE